MEDKERLEQAAELKSDESGGRSLTRRSFVASAGAAGAALFLGPGSASARAWSSATYNRALGKLALSSGMIGGPTGFSGAARYQYPANSAPGRAVLGLKRLTNNGKSPITINWRIWNGAVAQLNAPYPTKTAPSVAALLQKETGVKIKFVLDTPTDNDQKNLQTIATRDGSFNILQTEYALNGDNTKAGLLLPFDDYVATYEPDWSDKKYGYAGGATTTALFNKYRDRYVSVSMDGDYQVWAYRMDLFDNAANQKAFKAKYGWDLEFPQTWEKQAQVAEFFTQPQNKLYGSVDLKSPGWGYVNWMMRYVSTGAPNRYYFDPETGDPLINSPEGIQATKEHVASMAWTYSNALSQIWPTEYSALGAGQAAMGSVFSNATKFIVAGSPFDKGYGKYLRTALAPGRMVGGKLVRRPVVYFNANFGINAFSNKAQYEAAYLVLQYCSSAQISAWYTGNPGGYFDPNRNYQLNDPLVRASYKPYACDELKTIIPRTAPTIAGVVGAAAYTQALDTNLQAALSKQISPAKAMANTEAAWKKITAQNGGPTHLVTDLQAQIAAWPTIY
jgi:multiple sugar transport system substrate-binding protein